MTVFKFTTAEGKIKTRRSDRKYTHVVVGRANVAAMIANQCGEASNKLRAKNYRYYKTLAGMKAGDMYPGGIYPTDQSTIVHAKAQIEKCPTVEAFIADSIAHVIESHRERYGSVEIGPETVLQWSQSQRNAEKAVTGFRNWNLNVRVVALEVPAA